MIDHSLRINLPVPWEDQTFKTDHIGPINFLVGPNGSGKSQFAVQLFRGMRRARLLGTDRLSGMEQNAEVRSFTGDPTSQGYQKRRFSRYKEAGAAGSGIDTVVLLEERMDLRIRIEATLAHLFDREITLEWDSGNLIPMVTRSGGGASYRLDREECHGIKELLVLLTHLYDPEIQFLIVDEPELNLHPQYQAFFMQEVRGVAGDPNNGDGQKVVFLITHSPFILDLQSTDDIKSIISFDLDYSVPRQVASLDLDLSSPVFGTLRMNAHHKQLFFSDNPIFVEGIHDATLVEAMMKARGTSVAAAGSCIIDVGGVEQVNHYLKLCQGLGKTAHFLYDLDSLFRGNLRRCIGQDESIQNFLASTGLGNDLVVYCGQLDSKLNSLIDLLLESSLPHRLCRLGTFLKELGKRSDWGQRDAWPKARLAVMTAISRYREDVTSVVSQSTIDDVEGRLRQILAALKEKNVHVLSGGTLERYLPHFRGDEYNLNPDAKQYAVQTEIAEMVNLQTEEAFAQRYGELYEAVCNLPSKSVVDLDSVLSKYLSEYIHKLQRTVVNYPDWKIEQIQQRMNMLLPSSKRVFSISMLERHSANSFRATILINAMLGNRERIVRLSETTNAGMGDFTIEPPPVGAKEGTQ